MALKEVGVRLVAEGGAAFLNTLKQGEGGVRDFADTAEKSKGGISKFASSAISSLESVGKAALAFGAIGATAFAGFLASSVSVAADFEASMNRFSAITGDALDEAGLKIEDFSKLFLKLGADTQYSAQQAADAGIELAKGGIDVATISAGGLEAALNLAAAGELELAEAANITAKQYGVWVNAAASAEEKAAFLAEAADLLAQAANASTVNVDDLALGLANAGGVAKTAGLSFQETITTMALIAPAFSSAADAGTSFKTFLSRLIPTTTPAILAMEELGLWTEEAGSAFYDAQGNFVGMEKASQLLFEATKDLSEEQRVLAFTTIFGSDAVRAAAKIAEQGAVGFNTMGESMENAGTAAEQAKKRNQGFKFAMDQLLGSIETLQIVLGSALLPVLTEVIGLFTGGVNSVMEFFQGIAAAEDPMLALSNAISSIIPGFDGILAAMQPIIDIAMEIGAFLGDNLEPILISLAAVIGGAVVVALGSMAAAMVAAAAPVLALVAVGAALYKAWQENFLGIRDIVTSVLSAVWSVIQSVLGVVQGFVQQHGDSIKNFFLDAWESIKGIVQGALEIINGTIVPILTSIAEFISAHKEEIVTVLSAAWEIISTVVSTVLGVIQGVINTVLAVIKGDWEGAWEAIKGIFSTVWEAIKTIVSQALAVIELVLSLAWQTIKGAAESVWNSISKSISDIWEGIKTFISTTVNAIPRIILGIGKQLYDAGAAIIQQLWDGITDIFSGLLEDVRNKIAEIKAAVEEALGLNAAANAAQTLQQSVAQASPRAMGGPVKAMSRYLVGEQGPELFVPGRSGTILPTEVLMSLVEGALAAVGTAKSIFPPMSPQQLAGSNTYNQQRSAVYNFNVTYANTQSESSLIQDVKMMQMLRPEL